MLDPRYKFTFLKSPMFHPVRSDAHKKTVKDLIETLKGYVNSSAPEAAHATPSQPGQPSESNSIFTEAPRAKVAKELSPCEQVDEWELSDGLHIESSLADVLAFWKTAPFPALQPLALSCLGIPATQVFDERLYSQARNFHSENRRSMRGDTLSKLMFSKAVMSRSFKQARK